MKKKRLGIALFVLFLGGMVHLHLSVRAVAKDPNPPKPHKHGLNPSKSSKHGANPPKPRKSCVSGSCHKEQQKGRFQHGRKQKPLCTACHSQKEPDRHRFAPPKRGEHCAKCHKEFHHQTMQKKWGFQHGPVAVRACETCHTPHASEHKHLLKKSPNALCLDCHHDVAQPTPTQKIHHAPWKKQRCLDCHQPHGSSQRALMRDEPARLCLSCHKATQQKLTHQKAHHGALFQGQKCLNCHVGHASAHGALLRIPSASLCLDCHSQAIPRYGRHKRSNLRALMQSPVLHKPLQDGRCDGCHNAHGSPFPKLLRQAHPKGLYAAYTEKTYALCFSCHNAELASHKQTTTATRFRNGAFNLHWLHVHRKKGRSCGLCHDAHGTQQPRLIRKKIAFGTWQLPIGYQASKDGGDCATSCHLSRKYHRKQPVAFGYERYRTWLKAPVPLPQTAPSRKQRTTP